MRDYVPWHCETASLEYLILNGISSWTSHESVWVRYSCGGMPIGRRTRDTGGFSNYRQNVRTSREGSICNDLFVNHSEERSLHQQGTYLMKKVATSSILRAVAREAD